MTKTTSRPAADEEQDPLIKDLVGFVADEIEQQGVTPQEIDLWEREIARDRREPTGKAR